MKANTLYNRRGRFPGIQSNIERKFVFDGGLQWDLRRHDQLTRMCRLISISLARPTHETASDFDISGKEMPFV